MLDLQDKLCSFILRYKQHIEPTSRSVEVKVLEDISKSFSSQIEKIQELEEENLNLKIKLKELEEKEKEKHYSYKKLLADLKENHNDLIALLK